MAKSKFGPIPEYHLLANHKFKKLIFNSNLDWLQVMGLNVSSETKNVLVECLGTLTPVKVGELLYAFTFALTFE